MFHVILILILKPNLGYLGEDFPVNVLFTDYNVLTSKAKEQAASDGYRLHNAVR